MCKCTSFELATGPLTKDLSSVVWGFLFCSFFKNHIFIWILSNKLWANISKNAFFILSLKNLYIPSSRKTLLCKLKTY